MSEIRCIIVEDEPLASKVLSEYIAQVPFLELQGVFKNAIQAREFLEQHSTDLIFLDMHLPKLKGMAFLKTLTSRPSVIITTAYHQYAVEGFEMNVTDYLLKPFSFERFLAAVGKVRMNAAKTPEAGKPEESKDFVFVNIRKKKVRILFSEIIYIESQREYVRIVATSREFLVKMSTKEVEGLLPAQSFRRIHRSFIVAVNKIESYTAETVEVRGATLPIGREYRGVIEKLW